MLSCVNRKSGLRLCAIVLLSQLVIAANAQFDVMWDHNPYQEDPYAIWGEDPSRVPVIGSASWDYSFIADGDDSRVGIYDNYDGPGMTDLRGGYYPSPWLKGLNIREVQINADGTGDNTRGGSNMTGALIEGTRRCVDAPRIDMQINNPGFLTEGVAGIASCTVANYPTTLADLAVNSIALPVSGQISNIDQTKVFSDTGFIMKGWYGQALASSFEVWGDNAAFCNSAATYTVPSIQKAWGVRGLYESGKFSATCVTDNCPGKRHGALVNKFRGLEVGAKLQGDYVSTSDGTSDKIIDYVGVQVTPPLKLVKANDTGYASRANNAFGTTAIGLRIEAPYAKLTSTPTADTYVTPDAYVGLQCNATAKFNAPVTLTQTLTLPVLSSAPTGTITEGTLYVDSNHSLRIYLNGTWKTVSAN